MLRETLLWCLYLGVFAMAALLAADRAIAVNIGAYVDATMLNTGPGSSVVAGGNENDADGLWFQRPQAGARSDAVLTSGGSFEDCPTLTTTAPGLANGVYNVYVNYWTNPDADWNIRAAISGNPLAAYDRRCGTATGNVLSNGATERQALLGRAAVTNGCLAVNIDDWDGARPSAGTDRRTWYDGISYQSAPKRRPLVFDFASATHFCSSAPEYGAETQGYSPNIDPLGFQTVHTQITPSPYIGSYIGWNDARTVQLYDRLVAENRPVSMMLASPDACPLTGTNKDQLGHTIDYLSGRNYRLDYVWLDFESPDGIAADNVEVAEVVRQIRTHADSKINQARVGQYDYYRCSNMAWCPYPNQNSQAAVDTQNNAYGSTGVNVAMPSCYPYAYYKTHASSTFPGGQRSPNVRSALFWAPLAKFSNAKANLPAGDQLIPWVADFVPWDGYTAAPPATADNKALLQHMRLRGADGYYTYLTAVPSDMEQYRGDMIDAWDDLDWLFEGVEKADVRILNLGTNKTGAFEWSAVETPNGVAVLTSNLGAYGQYMESSYLLAAGMSPNYVEKLYGDSGRQWIASNSHVLNEYRTVIPEPAPLVSGLSGAILLTLRRARDKRVARRSRRMGRT